MDKRDRDELYELRKEQAGLGLYLVAGEIGSREAVRLRLEDIADRIGELTDDVFGEMWDQADVILGPDVGGEGG